MAFPLKSSEFISSLKLSVMRSEQTILFRIELVNLKYCLLTGGIRPDELENIVTSYEPVSIYRGLNQELYTGD